MEYLTPVVLAVSAIIAYWPERKNQRFLAMLGLLYGASMAIEAAGVYTGVIFGPYHYTSVLGWHIFSVPWIIGVNWIAIVFGAIAILEGALFQSVPESLKPLIVGLLVAGFDILLEPVAIHQNYWIWHTGYVPLQNYFIWGIMGVLFALLYYRQKKNSGYQIHSKMPAFYFLVLLGYFFVIRLSLLFKEVYHE